VRRRVLSSCGLTKPGEVVVVEKHGVDILNDPLYNKGTAFPLSERDRLGLRGLLPPCEGFGINLQIERVLRRFRSIKVPLNQYQQLVGLQDRNEVLFYRVLIENLAELAPVIYTPTVGEACMQFGNIYRRPRGMYFSSNDLGNMNAMVYNWPCDDVRLAVITDGSRVLGLGDLGVNGMGISVGKLSLYVAAAGIHPSQGLPVVVDVGTDNKNLLGDELYLGIRQNRLKGEQYYRVMDEVIGAIHQRWPNCLIQFEDFNYENAIPVLHRYRREVPCFNDDIQGTGAVVTSALFGALRAVGKSFNQVTSHKAVIVGAGAAGVGIAECIAYAKLKAGVSFEDSYNGIYLVDKDGLLGQGRTSATPSQRPFMAQDLPDKMPLLDVIRSVKPESLIGVTGVGGLFTETVVREMASLVERPFVFPLSNPTNHAECTAEQAFTWTQGRAIFASGSPFAPVEKNGVYMHSNQANNMFTFPGIGLGAIVCNASRISRDMLHAASVSLAAQMPESDLVRGKLFPDLSQIREFTKNVAVEVILAAQKEDIAQSDLSTCREELLDIVHDRMWYPNYGALVRPYFYHHK